MAEPKAKKTKVLKLVTEINISRENIIKFLQEDLKMEKITINSSLDSDVVDKVLSHFKKDIEDKKQHTKVLEKFTDKFEGIKFDEIETKKRQEEEENQEKTRRRRERKKRARRKN